MDLSYSATTKTLRDAARHLENLSLKAKDLIEETESLVFLASECLEGHMDRRDSLPPGLHYRMEALRLSLGEIEAMRTIFLDVAEECERAEAEAVGLLRSLQLPAE